MMLTCEHRIATEHQIAQIVIYACLRGIRKPWLIIDVINHNYFGLICLNVTPKFHHHPAPDVCIHVCVYKTHH